MKEIRLNRADSPRMVRDQDVRRLLGRNRVRQSWHRRAWSHAGSAVVPAWYVGLLAVAMGVAVAAGGC